MPINTSFHFTNFSKMRALFNIKSLLCAETLKERVMVAHHQEILEALIKYFNPNEDNPFPLVLKEILKNNWHKYKGTLCSYTAQPESDVTVVLCDIAEMVAHSLGEKPIHLLMPGVSTESIIDGTSSLDEMDLKAVLKTHILSESGNYLYPVGMLNSLQCESDVVTQQIPNPYFDYNIGPDNEAYIPGAALERMLNHSQHTQAILDAIVHYQSLIKPTNLLGQLQLLIKTLRINSVAGIGSETQAGSRAYAGIISFNDYYQTLNNEQKSAIPEDLKDEIELLLGLSSSKEQNYNGTENLQTCINTRQGSLEYLTKMHEPILINIGVDEQTQSGMIQKAREAFVLAQKQLQTQCAQGTYQGSDKLPLSRMLIDALNIHVQISSEADVQDFISLGATDIESLLVDNEPLQDQLVQKLDNLEALIIFTSQTPIEQMKKVLHFTAHKLPKPTAVEFSVWLEMLDLKRSRVVFNAFKDCVIGSGANFRDTLKHLSIEKRNMIFSAFENVFPNLIQTAGDFDNALAYLSHAQRESAYERLKDKLPSMIHNGSDIGCVLQFLNLEQKKAVYDVVKGRIPGLIQNAVDLAMALQFMNEKQCKEVLAALKGRLTEVCISAEDVNTVLAFLNVENRAAVFEAIKGRLVRLIKTANDVGFAFELLDKEQSVVVFKKIKNKLPKLIQSSRDIRRVLLRLNIEQCKMMLDNFKDILPKLLLKANDIGDALKHLGIEQSRIVLQLLPSKWTQSAPMVGKVLKVLNDTQRAVFFEMIQENLPSMIQNAKHVREVCEYLSDEQSNQVLCTMIDRIPSLIQTADDFVLVYRYLGEVNDDQIESVNKSIIEILSSVVKTCDDLGKILILAADPPNHYETLLDLFKDKLPNLLKSAIDVGKVLNCVTVNRRPALLEAIISRLPNVIKPAEDVVRLLPLFDLEQSPEVLNRILPSLIRNANHVFGVLAPLNNEQRTVVFEAFKGKLFGFIQTADDVADVLAYLCVDNRAAVYNAIKDQLPNLIQDAKDVSRVLAYLDREQFDHLFEAIKDKLPNLIHRAVDVCTVLRYFQNERQEKLFEAIKHKLPSLIDQRTDISYVFTYLTIEQRGVVLDGIKTKLPSLLTNKYSLFSILVNCNIKQCEVVLEAIKDEIPKLFETAADVDKYAWGPQRREVVLAALKKAQAQPEYNPPAFLPNHKRIIDGNEPAKRQRIGRREMTFLHNNAVLEQPREQRLENDPKRQRISR